MKRVLFLAPASPSAGLTTVALGLVRALDRRGIRVGFHKPIAQSASGEIERSTHFIRKTTQIQTADPIPLAEAEAALSHPDDLLSRVIADFRRLSADLDVMIVEGLVPSLESPQATTLNTEPRPRSRCRSHSRRKRQRHRTPRRLRSRRPPLRRPRRFSARRLHPQPRRPGHPGRHPPPRMRPTPPRRPSAHRRHPRQPRPHLPPHRRRRPRARRRHSLRRRNGHPPRAIHRHPRSHRPQHAWSLPPGSRPRHPGRP